LLSKVEIQLNSTLGPIYESVQNQINMNNNRGTPKFGKIKSKTFTKVISKHCVTVCLNYTCHRVFFIFIRLK